MLKYLKNKIACYRYLYLEKTRMTPYKLSRKDPTLYGDYIWCVRSKMALYSKKIYVSADEVKVVNGNLVFIGSDQATSNESLPPMDDDLPRNPARTTLIIAAGHWRAAYLTSRGQAASVSMWEGEVDKYHG